MQNGTLYNLVKQGCFTLPQSNAILLSLCETLHYIHSRNFIHGDLKLENILISGKFKIIMTDFGFAQPCDAGISTIFGSEGYTAPEIFTGGPIDLKKCDIFSLGVIYFILVTGSIPF